MDETELESICAELAERVTREAARGLGKKWRCPPDLREEVVAYAVICQETGEALAPVSERLGLVKTHLGRDPLSGDLFVFVSRNRKRAKVLLWDGTGLCLYAKRLERGQFANLWSGPDKAEIELTAAELQLFMEGSLLVGKVPMSPQRLCLKC